jgi:hypothetical protein
MRLFRSREPVGIVADTLRFALESSRETYHDEHMGFRRGTGTRDLGLDRKRTVATGCPDFGGFFDFSDFSEEDLL